MQTGIEVLSVERGSGLAVAASLTVAEFMLPRLIGELPKQEPALHPLLRVVNSETVAELVHNGDADVGSIEASVLPRQVSIVHLGLDALSIVTLPRTPGRGGQLPARRPRAVDLRELAYGEHCVQWA